MTGGVAAKGAAAGAISGTGVVASVDGSPVAAAVVGSSAAFLDFFLLRPNRERPTFFRTSKALGGC